jgi:hypothetical protein
MRFPVHRMFLDLMVLDWSVIDDEFVAVENGPPHILQHGRGISFASR